METIIHLMNTIPTYLCIITPTVLLTGNSLGRSESVRRAISICIESLTSLEHIPKPLFNSYGALLVSSVVGAGQGSGVEGSSDLSRNGAVVEVGRSFLQTRALSSLIPSAEDETCIILTRHTRYIRVIIILIILSFVN